MRDHPCPKQPGASDLKVFHAYRPRERPDGIAFGKTGKLYVELALPGMSRISILSPSGAEEPSCSTRRSARSRDDG